MPATPFDSPIWRSVFHDADIAPLFTDTAVLRAELLVMGTLALTQAKSGTVPEISAQAIQRAGMEIQVDPAGLHQVTGESGDPVAALIAAFQNEMKAPEHAKWVHHDSDTALTAATARALRMRQVLGIFQTRLHPESQSAGALDNLRPHLLRAYHRDAATRAGLAKGLGLQDAGDDASPAHGLICFAQWALDTAEMTTAHTPAQEAVAQMIPHLCQPLLAAEDTATGRLVANLALPQLCLGLATLTGTQTRVAN
ncbi:hypothetical protein [Yoonia sp. 208BN28-4]|uniref:hypothetical protein n=1 Tax=Yoonia sp. 208BN28-4 TaxID=3126505 RepID=UPI0030AA6773